MTTSLLKSRNYARRDNMPARKYSPEQIMQWMKTIRHLRSQHVPKKTACELLEKSCGVPAKIIGVYTCPSNYKAASQYNRYQRYGSYQTPEYDLKYKHLIRRLDKLLPQFFNGNSELSLTELTGRIESNLGIAMRESTLENLLGKYAGSERGPPVVKTESGKYQLNRAFYSKK